MASASGVLSEEHLLCSICLDVFSQPVTIPCGHNFCKACITKYWDSKDFCHCPMCKKAFERRAELFVNTLISEMATQLGKSAEVKVASSDRSHQDAAKPAEVPCDVCTGAKHKALKSCLVCLASYCETHLEPHQRIEAWKRHKLIHPVENLEDRMCEKHDKMLELFCRSDKVCVCIMCLRTDHKIHDVVLLEEEYEEKQAQLEKIKTKIKQMIEERQLNVHQIKHSVDQIEKDAGKEIADIVEIFTSLVASIQRHQTELIEVIEVKRRAAEKQGEGLIKELEQEIAELQRRGTELEQLSHTEDHLHLIQGFPSLSTPPPTKDWSGISIHTDLSVETVRRAVAQLVETLDKEMEKLPEVKLKRIQQQYAVEVTLDPDTAHPRLILSEDGKQVRFGDTMKTLPDNPERFDTLECVLGKEGFSSGRFYCEVQVQGKIQWSFGLVRESLSRKGKNIKNKIWLIQRNGDEYSTRHTSIIPLSLRVKPQKVGVFVDYERGQISFYDPESRALLYSFTGCNFTEKLYPLLCPGGSTDDVPLIITSVIQKLPTLYPSSGVMRMFGLVQWFCDHCV